MGTEALDKRQQQQEQLEILKSSYRSAWEGAFGQFMFLMAEQYSLELTVSVNGQMAESPIVKFWKESLQSLTPNQMREGLKRYMKSDRRSFKPTPGDIEENVKDVAGVDKPIKKYSPDCGGCHGTGFRMVERRSKLTGNTVKVAVDCFCVRIEYDEKSVAPVERQLPPPSQEDLEKVAAKIGNVGCRDQRLVGGRQRDRPHIGADVGCP